MGPQPTADPAARITIGAIDLDEPDDCATGLDDWNHPGTWRHRSTTLSEPPPPRHGDPHPDPLLVDSHLPMACIPKLLLAAEAGSRRLGPSRPIPMPKTPLVSQSGQQSPSQTTHDLHMLPDKCSDE
jgi:hypothetical protein